MDRNSVIGLLLIGLILILFSVYNSQRMESPVEDAPADTTSGRPTTETPKDTVRSAPENATVDPDAVPESSPDNPSTAQPDEAVSGPAHKLQIGLFTLPDTLPDRMPVLENDRLRLTVSPQGGHLSRVKVKGYTTYDGDSLILFDGPGNQFGYHFFIGDRKVSTSELTYRVLTPSAHGDTQQIALRTSTPGGAYLEHVYKLPPNSKQVHYQFNMVGMDTLIPRNNNYLMLDWRAHIRPQEKGLDYERTYTTLYYRYKADQDVTYLTSGETSVASSLEWISYKQQFFNATLIAPEGFDNGKLRLEKEETDALALFHSELALPYNHEHHRSYPMQFYFGANHYKELAALDRGLEEIIPLGWGIFGWINKYFIIPFFNWLSSYLASYGIIILIMTIVIKLLLMPLTYRSYLSMAKMKVLQPELTALKKKHEKNPQKFSSEQIKLFRKAGVNPLGGCIPMLLQLPILYAMFRFFPASIELRQQGFLWADDLSTYDSIMELPFHIPFYGEHVSLFTLLMALSMVLYTRMNTQMTSGPAAAQMKIMQYIMPFFMLFFFNNFAAALTYYFFLSNVITFGQQTLIKKFYIDEDKIHLQIQARKKKPAKKSKFQQRLENLAQERQKKK